MNDTGESLASQVFAIIPIPERCRHYLIVLYIHVLELWRPARFQRAAARVS